MGVASVLIQKSTKSIIRYADYPKAEVTPFLEGEIDPDYEWLIENIPFPEPSYDPRIYIMVTNLPDLESLSTFQDHPDYSGIKEYRITYSPEKRSNADIILSIENAEREANSTILSEADHKDQMIFMMASVNKVVSGMSLTEQEQLQLDKLTAVNVKLSKNLSNRNSLVAQLTANQVPNIDSGWEKL